MLDNNIKQTIQDLDCVISDYYVAELDKCSIQKMVDTFEALSRSAFRAFRKPLDDSEEYQ